MITSLIESFHISEIIPSTNLINTLLSYGFKNDISSSHILILNRRIKCTIFTRTNTIILNPRLRLTLKSDNMRFKLYSRSQFMINMI